MARGQTLLTNATAGEITPLLDIRSDLQKYKNGMSLVRNGIVIPHGGIRKRPGTMHIQQVKDEATPTPRLEPFQFNVEQSYIHEIGHEYVRFYKDRGIITDNTLVITGISATNPGVVTYTGTDPSNGQQGIITGLTGSLAPYLNGRRFTVANVDAGANTFEMSGFSTAALPAWTAGGSFAVIVEIATTYDEDEIDDLSFAQSADTQYIAHGEHALSKLTRASHVSWSLAAADIVNGPFRAINGNFDHVVSITLDAASATITNITQATTAVVTTSATHTFLDGETVLIASVVGMTQVNGKYFVVKNPTAMTFQLYSVQSGGGLLGGGTAATPVDSTGYTAYGSGGTAVRTETADGTIATGTSLTLTANEDTWTADNVGGLFRLWEPAQTSGIPAAPIADSTKTIANNDTYTQDGKVYAVASLNTWTTWGFVNRVPSHAFGTVRVVSAGSHPGYFDAVFLHDSSCVLRVTAYTNARSVTAVVIKNNIPKSVVDFGTSAWEEGAWSARRGFPQLIVFSDQRLWAFSTRTDPQSFWASRIRSPDDFQDGADDDDAIIGQYASDRVEVARWVASGRALLMGTANGEFLIAAGANNTTITPTNVTVRPQTPYGSSNLRPLRVSEAILFGQRHGKPDNPSRRIRETSFSFEKDGYVAPDVGIISNHITGSGVTEGAFQAAPDPVAWFVRSDGLMPALTYEQEQDVKGWHLHELGGTTALIKRAAVIPGSDGDELWLIVSRAIGGGTVHYIEVLTSGLTDELDKEDGVYLDSALTYSGSAATTLTGLWHLEGQSVQALADGSKVSARTVANGSITLDIAASLVHVGLPYTMRIQTLDLDALAQAGTAKTRPKKISNVHLNVYRSLGGRCGHPSGETQDIIYRSDSDAFGSSPALRTQFVPFPFPRGWEEDMRILIEHDEPYPFTLLGIEADMQAIG